MDMGYFIGGLLFFIAPPIISVVSRKIRKKPSEKNPALQYVIVFFIMVAISNHDYLGAVTITGLLVYLLCFYIDYSFYKRNPNQELTSNSFIPTSNGDLSKISDKNYSKEENELFGRIMTYAEEGDLLSQLTLANMYEQGKGVPQDYSEAERWYLTAAEQGSESAQNIVGHMYSNGSIVPQNYKEAIEWFKKSADQGNADAQFSLGVMYQEGYGVRQNMDDAKEWFGKSCDNGYQKGCDNYRMLNQN